jgi:hypothetical protein
LVSAISFSPTGDPGHTSFLRAARPAPRAEAAAHKPARPNGHAATSTGKSGVQLKLKDKPDDQDSEFERY